MSISTKFSDFCSALSVPAGDRSTIATRCRSITKRLNQDYWDSDSETARSLYVGSYGRGTATSVFSDVDLIMELPWSLHNKYDAYQTNGQSALLQAVRSSIKKTYSTTSIGADGQVIVVSFTSGARFEVVPAFPYTDGSYRYADSNGGGSWKTTNPRPEIKAISDRDQAVNNNLKRLARMVRSWRDYHSVYMGGLLVDTFCYRFIQDWPHKDKSFLYYDFMTRDFFKYLSNENDLQSFWYAPGSNQQVTRGGLFKTKAKSAYETALAAIEHENKNEEWSANQKWKAIYGYSF